MATKITIETECGCKPPPPRPRKPFQGEKVQVDMASFGIKFGFPTPGASDVAQRELTVTVNGGDPPMVRTYTAPADVSDQWVFQDADHIAAVLVDIDGHGNRSQPSSTLAFDVVDDVPPPAPNSPNVAEKVQLD